MSEAQSPPTEQYRLAIRRPVTTAMVFLTLVVFGWKSYEGLSINLMPDISYPTLTVRTEYEGAAPEDVEKLLTRPLEETLAIVPGMVQISSVSSPGLSEIVLEFTWDTDMNTAQQDVILPYVEDGTVQLIGATTENPSFEVIAPLLSRARVVRLKQLGPEPLSEMVSRALADSPSC